ncbi:MAG: hypothetical protein HC869_05320 [Rhodospirillales bacterium]|nr:hypothetical protein [Rhodospirillales bacterium]
MNKQDFLEEFGAPVDSYALGQGFAESLRGRVPDDLISFWLEYGVGSYAGGFYRFCTPDFFDPFLSWLLTNTPSLNGKLAAVGYSAFGVIDLCHVDGRYFNLIAQFASIQDQSSNRATMPLPYNIAELYALSGAKMPDDPEEVARQMKLGPLTVWDQLATGASEETYRNYFGEDDLPLPAEVERLLGPVSANEVYLRRDVSGENVASSYEKVAIGDLPAHILVDEVEVNRFIQVDGLQDVETETFFIPGR